MLLEIIVIVVLLSLIIALIGCIKIIKINLKKVAYYENWVILLQDRLHDAYIKLKNIDDKQMFEKDDDVGFIFQEILTIVKDIDEKIEEEVVITNRPSIQEKQD